MSSDVCDEDADDTQKDKLFVKCTTCGAKYCHLKENNQCQSQLKKKIVDCPTRLKSEACLIQRPLKQRCEFCDFEAATASQIVIHNRIHKRNGDKPLSQEARKRPRLEDKKNHVILQSCLTKTTKQVNNEYPLVGIDKISKTKKKKVSFEDDIDKYITPSSSCIENENNGDIAMASKMVETSSISINEQDNDNSITSLKEYSSSSENKIENIGIQKSERLYFFKKDPMKNLHNQFCTLFN